MHAVFYGAAGLHDLFTVKFEISGNYSNGRILLLSEPYIGF